MSSSSSGVPCKRPRLLAQLRSHGGCTKSALAHILHTLHDQGLLSGELGGGSERRIRERTQEQIEACAKQSTPYGRVIQQMPTGLDDFPMLDYIHPLALLWVLCAMSSHFFAMLTEGRENAMPFKLVTYVDEIAPGNPLRHEQTRLCQCLYWIFADLPSHIVVQSGLWCVFTVVRTTIVNRMPGKLSGLMKRVLFAFFPKHNRAPSLARGILVCHGGRSAVVSARFSGFVGDEKALKEIVGLKGAGGTKCCPTCSNVVRFLDADARHGTSLVGLDCSNYELLNYHTNQSFYDMVDRLKQAKRDGLPKTRIAQMEQIFGLHLDEDNICFDTDMRDIFRPIDHIFRDWMHTLVSNGTAGGHMAFLFKTMKDVGISYTYLSDYAVKFTLPKALGTVNKNWFSADRIGADQLRTFASEQLNMIPIVNAFLNDVIAPTGRLEDHRRCFSLLHRIVAIFSKGPSGSMRYVRMLPNLISEHNELCARLYPGIVKPKLHQLMHIPENMNELGCLVSCFPTERKHRVVKDVGLHTFRHYEHTVLHDLLAQHLTRIEDVSQFANTALINPQEVEVGDIRVLTSPSAKLPCCQVARGDLILHSGTQIAEVVSFWSSDNIVFAQAIPLQRAGSDLWWSRQVGQTSFIDSSDIECPVAWAQLRRAAVRVCIPPVRG